MMLLNTHRKFIDVFVEADYALYVTLKVFRDVRHEIICAITKSYLRVFSALDSTSTIRVVAVDVQKVFVCVTTFPFFRSYETGAFVVLYSSY